MSDFFPPGGSSDTSFVPLPLTWHSQFTHFTGFESEPLKMISNGMGKKSHTLCAVHFQINKNIFIKVKIWIHTSMYLLN